MYAHQEKYDGTGYRADLRAMRFLLGARIFSVADTLDAITRTVPTAPAQLDSPRLVKKLSVGLAASLIPTCSRLSFHAGNIWGDLRKQINSQSYRFAYSATNKP